MLTNENKIQKHWSLICWKPAIYPYCTLNTDGSSFGNTGITGFGAVLRSANGKFISAATDGLPQGTSFLAEAMGVRMGLMMEKDCGVTHVQLQVDSTSLLPGILNDGKEATWIARHIFSDVNSLISTFICFNVISIFRKGNFFADALAKLGSSLGSSCYWNVNPPDIIKTLLTDDMIGRSTPRCISTKFY
ncbi:Ethylene responsive transcription factor 1b [Thalictrum thalictroides]|uniref:Ethylene responsive transcription factor 1b n=1 Tax=Thalictrum thalictroides TaxID=46969 RepID=A0A7J6VL28_THATH|nr:Ethylene responsive transcription factor 1b [Thalictrum thalictroides]